MCRDAQFCSVLLFLSSGASYDITQFQKYLGYFWFFISSTFRIKLTDARCRKRQRQMVLFILPQWHPGSNCSKSLEWIFLDFSVSLHSYTKPHMYGYTYCIQLWESAHVQQNQMWWCFVLELAISAEQCSNFYACIILMPVLFSDPSNVADLSSIAECGIISNLYSK